MPRKEFVEGETFKTILTNCRRSPVRVIELSGLVLEVVEPGKEKVLESCSKDALYAPWAGIVWEKDGTVKVIERKGFSRGDIGSYPLRIINEGGRDPERRMINGQMMFLPKGVPVTIGLTLASPEIRQRQLRIVRVERMDRSSTVKGFYEFSEEIEDRWDDRTPAELQKIERLLEETKDWKRAEQ